MSTYAEKGTVHWGFYIGSDGLMMTVDGHEETNGIYRETFPKVKIM